jgi:hypothetical protein
MEARNNITDPELHQQRFLNSLQSVSEVRKLTCPSRNVKALGVLDVQIRRAIPFYRFEGIFACADWSISDASDAWPLIDELRQALNEFEEVDNNGAPKTRMMKRSWRTLRDKITGLVDRIECENRQDTIAA